MNLVNKIKDYFQGVISESKKVIWPTRREVINHTLTVIGAVVVAIIIFGSLDFMLAKLLEYVIKNWG